MATGYIYQRKVVPFIPSPNSLKGGRVMSHWSRQELAMLNGTTDHWSKLRCKSYKLSQLPTGNYVALCKPQMQMTQKKQNLTRTVSSGTLANIGSPEFNQYLFDRLHNHCPQLIRPRPPSDPCGYSKRGRVTQSAYSQRAKLGYKYWIDDSKTKGFSTGSNPRREIGSKGTHLGIGVPRL